MDEQDFLNRIAQSMNESEEQLLRSLGRTSSRATREQVLKQVEKLDAARSRLIQEENIIDECGRILLTEEMKTSLHNAERSFENGRCLNKEQFHKRFAKWL